MSKDEAAGNDSLLTVAIAFGANLLIAIAKSVAAAMTGSASLVAEAAHSWADAGNEVFLLIAERRSARPRDASHPLGYGREAYVWSMFAAFGLFAMGSMVSIVHGLHSLDAKEEATDYSIGFIVLGVSFLLEGVSFMQALRQARRTAEQLGLSTWRYIVSTSNPTLRAVFIEDAAALIGLAVAAAGLALHQVAGDGRYDAAGSIIVGVLLGVVAIFLIRRNREFLTGQVASPAVRERVLSALREQPEIASVSFLHLEFIGPEQLLLVAAVDLAGDPEEKTLAARYQAVEERLEQHPVISRALLTPSRHGGAALQSG